MTEQFDVTIVGGGHNALVAAAYLAKAGHRTVVLERLPQTGGAAVSARAFAGVDARLSRYSYLVALLPASIIADLGLRIDLRSRAVASYTPVMRDGESTGLLVERQPGTATADSFRALTGGDSEYARWREFYTEVEAAMSRLAPSLTEPLRPAADIAKLVGERTWQWLATTPLGLELDARFSDDTVRGVVATDALIGTFTSMYDQRLLQNICFLYHLVGNGTGEWKVPVGGMGAVTDALLDAALAAGAEVRTGAKVIGLAADETGAETTYRSTPEGASSERASTIASRLVLFGAAPSVLAEVTGADPGVRPSGSQLKVNLLLERLPQWRSGVDPATAFAGTLHVAEGYRELEGAWATAADGRLPDPQPGEFYCHSLTDPSILSAELAGRGWQTLTYFGVHTPGELFTSTDAAESAVNRALAALDEHLTEPIRDCLAVNANGRPCLEFKTPADIEQALRMPGGHIFHGDLTWPWLDHDANAESPAERWGVATHLPTVLMCGSGARRGGAVSGLGGHNAAQAALELL